MKHVIVKVNHEIVQLDVIVEALGTTERLDKLTLMIPVPVPELSARLHHHLANILRYDTSNPPSYLIYTNRLYRAVFHFTDNDITVTVEPAPIATFYDVPLIVSNITAMLSIV